MDHEVAWHFKCIMQVVVFFLNVYLTSLVNNDLKSKYTPLWCTTHKSRYSEENVAIINTAVVHFNCRGHFVLFCPYWFTVVVNHEVCTKFHNHLITSPSSCHDRHTVVQIWMREIMGVKTRRERHWRKRLSVDEPHLARFPPLDLVWDCPPSQSEGDPQEPKCHSPRTQLPSGLLRPSLLLLAGTHTWQDRQTDSCGTKGQESDDWRKHWRSTWLLSTNIVVSLQSPNECHDLTLTYFFSSR